MIKIRVISQEKTAVILSETGSSLLEILRQNGYSIYAPCGGKGTCGKCLVNISGRGPVLACTCFPAGDIETELPGEEEARILAGSTEFLEDLPVDRPGDLHISPDPFGMAIDIGTTTVVIYFVHMLTGQIRKIASFINPQRAFGSDVISRISHCQLNQDGLAQLQRSITRAINDEINAFIPDEGISVNDIGKVVVAGNTTMLHMLLGVDPVSIAMAPFTPEFIDKQSREAGRIGLNTNPSAEVITLPCISAYVGADILAGLAALKVSNKNYLFLDIGTNGEMALVRGREILACATAAGPAFEGASLSCGMGAVTGAISVFHDENRYHVIGNTDPRGICGSGIIDIVAWLFRNELIDESGLLEKRLVINGKNDIGVNQQDIREIQLAKSAIFSGIKVLLKKSGLTYDDIDAMYLAGGFGHYINISSALAIGLLPHELEGRIFPVGNSSGFGALQYLKSLVFEEKTIDILSRSRYIELSGDDDFTVEFAMNIDFNKDRLY